LFPGAERHAKADQHHRNADCRTGRKSWVEREDAGRDRYRAERHQDIDDLYGLPPRPSRGILLVDRSSG